MITKPLLVFNIDCEIYPQNLVEEKGRQHGIIDSDILFTHNRLFELHAEFNESCRRKQDYMNKQFSYEIFRNISDMDNRQWLYLQYLIKYEDAFSTNLGQRLMNETNTNVHQLG